MVEAIVDKRKTQTRRFQGLKKINIEPDRYIINKVIGGFLVDDLHTLEDFEINSKYEVGDILWVRESWDYSDDLEEPYLYRQKELDELKPEFFKRMKWKPSIHMHKETCRLFLECTSVRVERLREISPSDAIQEGVKLDKGLKNLNSKMINSVIKFRELWEKINGKDSWESNPWVWVYYFKLTERPTNFLNNE